MKDNATYQLAMIAESAAKDIALTITTAAKDARANRMPIDETHNYILARTVAALVEQLSHAKRDAINNAYEERGCK